MLVQAVMEAEAATKTGASFGERSPVRTTYRNGYRARLWDTRMGGLELQLPEYRRAATSPSCSLPQRSEPPLLAVVQQAYVEGVATHRVEDLVRPSPSGSGGSAKADRTRSTTAPAVPCAAPARPISCRKRPPVLLDACLSVGAPHRVEVGHRRSTVYAVLRRAGLHRRVAPPHTREIVGDGLTSSVSPIG